MKYEVKQSLKISTEDGSEVGTLKPGYVFEAMNAVELNGNKYLKDSDGYLFLNESVVETKSIIEDFDPDVRSLDFWWHEKFYISGLWDQGYTGKGVKVAVLDSGLALPHKDLNIENKNTFDVTDSGSGIKDYSGHGTHISGIIKASNNGYGVTGIAYNSVFYFAKVTHDIWGGECRFLTEGIEWAIQQEVDVINVSRGYRESDKSFKDNKSKLRDAVKKAYENNILMVCAAGNKSSTSGTNIFYPARYQETLSVGGTKENHHPVENSINIKNTQIFAPGEMIKSTSTNNSYKSETGSSQACAFVTGVAALIIEKLKHNNHSVKPNHVIDVLIANSDEIHATQLINPSKAMSSL